MLKAIKDFFSTRIEPAEDEEEQLAHRLQLATAALLIEVMQADGRVTPEELATVRASIRRTFKLEGEETEELLRLARREADEAHSLYDFTRLIDQSFSRERKKQIIELLWRVAFSDGQLEKHEEHLIRRISNLIHVEHRAFIEAKQAARRAVDVAAAKKTDESN